MADKEGRNKRTYWRRREDIERKPGKPKLAILLIPLLIAVLTVGVSWYSGFISIESDDRRTKAQINSAEELARSKMEREQFEKAAHLYKTYYGSSSDPKTKTVIIFSLSAYGMPALNFLIQMRKDLKKGGQITGDNLLDATENAITRILTGTQRDLTGMDLSDESFRFATLKGMNLNEADFSRANLFMANLEDSNLIKAVFIESDLVGTNFKSANLRGARFRGALLRNSDFTHARLQGTDFTGAIDVDQAEFSPRSLVYAKFDKTDLDKLIKKYNSELNSDDSHKAVQKKLISKRDNQQIIIDQIPLEKSYALNR